MKRERVVEVVVETLAKIPKGASCFVERDGPRLVVKIWKHGILQDTRSLRATSLPVGSYHVVEGNVVHRHDPGRVISELETHQHRVRMQSPEFFAIAKRMAKKLGGRLENWETDEGDWIGYLVQMRGAIRDIDAKRIEAIDRVGREFVNEAAIVVRTGSLVSSPIGICVAKRDLDLVPQICTHWDDDVEKLIRRIDAECGAHIDQLWYDLIVLALDKKPKEPKPLARAIARLAHSTELEFESLDDEIRGLENRKLFLWWD